MGIQPLQKYIYQQWGLAIEPHKLFYEKYSDEKYRLALSYVYTIMKFTKSWRDRWGTPTRYAIIQSFDKTLAKL